MPRPASDTQPINAPERPGYVLSKAAAHTAPKDDKVELMQFVGVLWRGKWLILAFILLAGFIGSYYSFKVAVPKYTSTARLALEVRTQQLVDLESVMSGVSTEQAAINTELDVIRSRGLIENLVVDLNLVADPEFNRALQEEPKISIDAVKRTIKRLFSTSELQRTAPNSVQVLQRVTSSVRGAVRTTAKRNTYLFDVIVTTENPKKSEMVANRLSELYLENQIEIKFAATEYAVGWLSSRVTELEMELKQKEDALKTLRSETDLVSFESLEALNVRAKSIRDRLTEAQVSVATKIAELGSRKALVAKGDLQKITAAFNDPTMNRLLEAALAGNRASQADFRLRQDNLLKELRSDLDRAEAQRDGLQNAFTQLQGQIEVQSVDLVKLDKMTREVDSTRLLYETFRTRLKETSIQIGLQRADSRILSAAIPGELIQPQKTKIIFLALMLGGVLGAGFVLLRYLKQDGFRTAEELEQATGLTVLGQIPRMPIWKRSGLVEYLISNPTSAAAEAVRNLRTSVLMSNLDNPAKVILSTSSVPGEGKTTQSIALAQNLAGLGQKVLLIEGDIRRRTFSQYFKQEFAGGLVSVISGDLLIEDAVLREPALGIDILMGDKSSINAADLFSSQKFRAFIDEMRAKYDYVIIDTPPVLVVPDARVIGELVDTVLYTVFWDHTHKTQVLEGLRQFSSIGVHVTGLVLSQVDPRGMKRYGYGYGGKYGSYTGYYDI